MWAVAVLLTFGLAGTTQGMPQQESGQVWTTASTGSNCKLLYEEIHSQKCKPKQVEKCVTVNFQTDDVDYKRVCKDVTSVHCPTTKSAQYGLNKREAEAEAQWPFALGAYQPLYGSSYQPLYQTYPSFVRYQPAKVAPATTPAPALPATVSAVPVKAVPVEAVPVKEVPAAEGQCHQVTTEHCLSQPVKVSKTIPIETCHPVQQVECEPYVQKLPKTVCTPVAGSRVGPAKASNLYNPFAYGPDLPY